VDFVGWFLVSIVMPLTLPALGVLPLQLLPLPAPTGRIRLMATVKDGQLCWVVVAMGASAIYELWRAITAHRPIPPWSGIALSVIICAMVAGMSLAAGGAVFSSPLLTTRPGGLKAWATHYRVFVTSAALSAVVALAYAALHASMLEP
jgi:hypothetical protein